MDVTAGSQDEEVKEGRRHSVDRREVEKALYRLKLERDIMKRSHEQDDQGSREVGLNARRQTLATETTTGEMGSDVLRTSGKARNSVYYESSKRPSLLNQESPQSPPRIVSVTDGKERRKSSMINRVGTSPDANSDHLIEKGRLSPTANIPRLTIIDSDEKAKAPALDSKYHQALLKGGYSQITASLVSQLREQFRILETAQNDLLRNYPSLDAKAFKRVFEFNKDDLQHAVDSFVKEHRSLVDERLIPLDEHYSILNEFKSLGLDLLRIQIPEVHQIGLMTAYDALHCSYLRIGPALVQELEDLCWADGINPGIHKHRTDYTDQEYVGGKLKLREDLQILSSKPTIKRYSIAAVQGIRPRAHLEDKSSAKDEEPSTAGRDRRFTAMVDALQDALPLPLKSVDVIQELLETHAEHARNKRFKVKTNKTPAPEALALRYSSSSSSD